VPIVAMLHAGGGERFITLVNRLGASKDAVSATLAQLIDDGVVQRNPGYGHPLRPEYLVSPAARDLAQTCLVLVRLVEEMGQGIAAGRKWAFPAVLAIHRGASRYGEIQALLPGVTPRALSAALKDVIVAELATRAVSDGYPPAVKYALTPTGHRLSPALDAFAAAADALPSAAER
jgi:DNA-binding HxlR family transcriptional regulator